VVLGLTSFARDGGEIFWMPSTIASRTTSGSGTFHAIVWSYRASYRNYHKLEVTSRILPASEVGAPLTPP
jgi:hypothetical protein